MQPRTPGPTLIHAPVLATERLVLRAPEVADFDAYAAFCATPRARFIEAAADRDQAWCAFATGLGHWLLRGYGMFTLIERDTHAVAGYAGLWYPEGAAEPTLEWALFDGFEGRGLAAEALRRLLAFAADSLALPPLASHIAPGNPRSLALARRVGARHEADVATPDGPAQIWRHADFSEKRRAAFSPDLSENSRAPGAAA